MKVNPIRDRILVKPADAETKTAGGLFIPDNAKEGPVKGHNVEPIYFDIELKENKKINLEVPKTHNSFIYLLKGELKIGENKHEKISDSTLILLERGTTLEVLASKQSKFLFIAGKPIGEPIARGGPFVMNTKQEILQAIQDYNNGTFAKY